MEIDASLTPVSTFGAADGAISVAVTGGTPPYSYRWNTGQTTKDLTGLTAGAYMLRVLDNNSGVVEQTFVLAQPAAVPLDLAFTSSAVTRFGGNDGSASVAVSGGSAPYGFLWSNGETTAELTGLTSGFYAVTVTDAGSPAVVTVDSVFVSEPDFVCGRDSIADVDGNKYATVDLGGQCWTAANLRTRSNPKRPGEAVVGVFCDGLNCTNEAGAHYTWEAATVNAPEDAQGPIQGICPCEWHLPTVAEWAALNSYLSVNGNGGAGVNVPNKLRGADSSSGFDARYVGNWGFPLFDGELAAFWTASAAGETTAIYRLVNAFPLLAQGNAARTLGLSVRCVKD